MRTIEEFLFDLGSKEVKLWVEDNLLRYEAPRGVITPVIKSEMASRKAEILAFLAETSGSSRTHIQLVPRNQEISLSFAQKRLWLISQLEPDSSYNISNVLRIHGSLDLPSLQKTLSEVVRRHESLRTNFVSKEGQPVQIVRESVDWHMNIIDLQKTTKNEREDKIQRLALEEANKSFALDTDCLIRATLLLASATEQILLLTMHHIVSDGWSMGVLIEEVTALYSAFVQGKPSPLPELKIQYVDFAGWQKEWLQDNTLERQINYWRKRLVGAPNLLELPTDRHRPRVQSTHGANYESLIPLQITEVIDRLTQQEGTTLFMTLLAAFDLLLYRYTGQTDIVIGSPIANRNHPEIENLIGFFVNTLVLRSDLSGDPTFRELLKRVREVSLGAYAHQDLPFEMLVEILQPERKLSHSPLFQVMFVLQNTPASELELQGVTLSTVKTTSSISKFDLTLSLTSTQDGLAADWEYNTDLFNANTISRMAKHFEVLLAGITKNPDCPISTLPIITTIERQQLLIDWNKTQADYPSKQCIHQLFEAQVTKTPDEIAVVCGTEQLTYQELNNRANQLARYLQCQNIKPQELVGICIERSIEMLISILAVWKAGAAYVPLDPSYPSERLSFILVDAQVEVMLTQPHLLTESSPQSLRTIVLEPLLWSELAQISLSDLKLEIPSSNLANVIYTSGSTGVPKGVMVQHQGLHNLAQAQIKLFNLASTSRVLQFASLNFDASSWEILMAIGSGGTLYIDSKNELLPGEDLFNYLQTRKITHVTLPPAALAVLPVKPLQDLSTIIVAGETCSPELIRKWSPSHNFFNAYGPTEGTVCATISAPLNGSEIATIGRPISNVQVYILDAQLQPLPIGIPGELYIGGHGVTRGYLNRPDLTAEKFIADPFSDDSQARLYKTGDLARYLADGNIEYLGRIDRQVKIRGFRVELGEIEAAISKHSQVAQVTVIDREDKPGNKVLAAYLVPQPAQTISTAEIRNFLKGQLPDYMLPTIAVCLDELPLTPNGKIDREALPVPDFTQLQNEEYVAPRNEVEKQLSRIWMEVLAVSSVGVYDNFFELGGHSLLATQLMSRVSQTFGVEVPLRKLFEANTIDAFAAQIQYHQADKSTVAAPPLIPVSRSENIALSFAQQRLWFINQLEPNSPAYNMPEAVRFHGQLDIPALEKTLQEIIRRHEALRTNFISQDGQPIQLIHQSPSWKMTIIDLQQIPSNEKEERIQQLATVEATQPFALDTDSLLRATLLLATETEQILLLTMHHIVSDGWSSGVLTQEIATIYSAFVQGEDSPLPELDIQYVDFAVWQREWLQGEVLERQISYWQKQLAGAPALLELSTDRPRPAVQKYNGATYESAIPAPLSQEIEALAKREGATLFMTLLAAFNVLLHRYTGQVDVVVGSPIANRNHTEIEKLIGFFVNTLVLRSDLSKNPTFRELLKRVKEVSLGAYAHQDLPFEMLVETLQPERNLSHSPLFQVMFVLQNTPSSDIELPGVTLSSIETEGFMSPFDLTLSLNSTAEGLEVDWEYNTDLFDASTIQRMAEHFEILLVGIAENIDLPISTLTILTVAEGQKLLVDWNNTQTEYPQEQCIHQLFEKQVNKTPEAVAIVCGAEQLTYQELNTRANQLAHHLQTLGVKTDVLVGLCVERSSEMIVGMLAILKAGGAYVPLDPEYPSERLAYMVAEAQVSVLLTQERLLSHLPTHESQILVCLDRDWLTIQQADSENLVCTNSPDSLAYVIYTSGSTGQPKGVMVTQQNLTNFCSAAIDTYKITDADRILQFASVSFDVAAEEIYPGLIQGASIYLRNTEMLNSVSSFWQQCADWQLTLLDLPTAYWQQLTPELENIPASVRLVIIGGERANPTQVKLWQEKVGGYPQLINAYGPTETTVEATCCNLTDVQLSAGQEVPIGKPLANMRAYILDPQLQLSPVGVPGELYIGGHGVTRGYLNRPDLTAEKFIADPFSDDSQARLYKTGDLARYLADGNIEYLGRIDRQVKIRGFRVELGEIEAAISKHSQVAQVTVIDREDKPGNKVLAAYLVPQPAQTISTAEIRNFLKGQLPDYMLPTIAVCLDELPLTPNGKIDREALPVPDFTQLQNEEYVAPRNEVEKQLSRIWMEVLAVSSVGVYDNFFELGGHSLLATQLMSRVSQTFGVEVPLRKLFEANTIDAFAAQIQYHQADKSTVAAPPLIPVSRSENIALSFAQQRLWFINQLEPNSPAYNMPEAVRFHGQLDIPALEKTLQEIIRRHEALRTNFISQDGQPIQLIHQSPSWKMTIIDLQQIPSNEKEERIQQLATVEATQPFALDTDSLLRATLLLATETEQILLLTMHHIVSDGWSSGVLTQEIATIYSAFVQGEDSPLPELDIQYVDFAVWQREWLQGEVLERQISYWQKQLAGAPALLELSTDRPRPAVQKYNGATYESAIPAPLSQEIEALAKREGATLFMTLLAAFNVLLHRYTGQVDVVVGSPIANRNHTEIEKLIGFFVNTLVLRSDLSKNPTFRELLKRVKEVSLGAYAHQDLPFEMLVETLQPERNLSHSPLFQVMFVLQNTPSSDIELPGVTLSSIETEGFMSPFDLTLSLNSTAEGLEVDWEYNTDLFDASTIQRMAEHFEILLVGIAENIDLPISTLTILTVAEGQKLLVDWNNTQTEYPQEQCIHQLFEKQVNKTPEAVAIVCGAEQLTYQELNTRANQLAHHLQTLGVKTDVLVGLCVERSSEMIVGMLAILKAGGAYVPLDPEYPSERLAYMVAEAQVSVLLTQERLLSHLPTHESQILVCLDRDWLTIQQADSENLVCTNSPDSLAYVIYTSGSTGQPKGVMVTQQNLTNFCSAAIDTYKITDADRILQFASVSFDVAAEEIYPGLIQGASIYLRNTEMLNSVSSFWQQCADWQLTLVDLPTAYWQQLTAELENIPAPVRLVVIGGERANPTQVKIWQEQIGNYPQLINAYGPTETTVEATCCNLTNMQLLAGQEVPIGKPLANMQVYILDPQLQLSPVGVPGELYIGGHGVTRGYLNRPDLTAEKFIADPFSDDFQARLYKTGDLARYLADGNIEYLGRIDRQVKIRGFRVELGEIEAAISKHPQVAQVTVIDREDKPGNKVLAAYLVPQRDQAISTTEIRTFLKGQLPDYMLPAIIVCLNELPLTPNGKIDREALPVPDFTQLQSEEYIAPENATEEILVDIWKEVLGVDKVGIHDNFFELGGHSLLAVQLLSKTEQKFQTNLSLSILFQNTTIKQIASILTQPEKTLDWSPLVKIKSSGSKLPFFCIPGGGGNPIYLSDLAYELDSDRPFYGLQAKGLDGEVEAHTNVEDMAKCYIQAIQSVQENGPYLIGGHSFGAQVALEVALQFQEIGQKVALLVVFDGGAPITTINAEVQSKSMEDDDVDWLRELGIVIGQLYETELEMPDEVLRCLDTEDRFKYFQQQLAIANLPIAGYKIKQLKGLLNIFKVQNQITYETNDTFQGQIVLFQTTETEGSDSIATYNTLEDWSRFSAKKIINYDTPGNHYRMMSEPHVQALAANLRNCINQAVGD